MANKKIPDINYDAARTLNGEQTVTGNRTIPNEAEISWWISQMKALKFPVNTIVEQEVFDYSATGFDKFCVLLYMSIANFVSSNWDYNDKMMKDLFGIDKYILDNILVRNGTCAVVKKGDKYYPLPYQAIEYDIVARPTKIKIHWTSKIDDSYNDSWEGTEFENTDDNKEFVIFDNDPTKFNMILKNIGWVQVAYRAMCEIYENIFSGATHFAQLSDIDWDMLASDNAVTLNEQVIGRQKVVNYVPKVGDEGFREDKVDSWDKWSKSLLKFEMADRLQILWDTFYNAMDQLKQVYGMSANSNVNKRERQITDEIETQQDLPEAQKMAMFNKRKYAIDKANEYWPGLGWDIQLTEQFQETPENDQNEPNNDKINEESGEDNE